MKKFFTLLCAVVIALGANAAPQLSKHLSMTKADFVAAQIAKNAPVKIHKHAVANKPVVKTLAAAPAAAGDFTITVSNITFNSASVDVEPANATAGYYWHVIDVDFYNEIMNGDYAQYGITDICGYFQYDLDYTIQMYAQFGMALTYDDLLYVGPDAYDFTDLEESTQYYVVAVYMDENGCTSDAVIEAFETPEFELSGVVATFTAVDVEVYEDYLADYGALEVAGFDAHDNVFDILFYVQDGFVGSYTEADIEGAGLFVPAGDDYEELAVLSASFTVAATATADVYVLTGDFTMANGDLYHVTMTFEAVAPEPVDAYEFDAETGVTLVYDNTTAVLEADASDYNTYGVVYYMVSKADGSDMLMLYLFPNALTAEGLCADGVYTIDGSMNAGTCFASAGYDGESVYPSLYGTSDAQGYIIDVWFLVSGNVTISNNGHNFVVNALNSKGAAVKYTYTEGGAQAIENNAVRANATKALVNGALVIEKAGVKYNMVGARL